jgi:uncharacterized membrane protein YesL
MKRFFQLDNPVWKFIGNLADFFVLSVLWYLSCIPVVTLGCGTSAMYYVTLKMADNQEGYTIRSFLKAFRRDWKQCTLIWLIFLGGGLVITIDLYWCLLQDSLVSRALFITFILVAIIYLLCLTFIFPLVARCDNTIKRLLGMCFVISLKNFLPILSAIVVTMAFFMLGVFVFPPVLLVAPGLSAYLNSFLFQRVFEKYHLNLPDDSNNS